MGVLALTLLMSGVALAATPQEIYDDFASDGKLDGNYTDSELRAYLNDATLHQYGDPGILDRLDNSVQSSLGRDTFPFTGFQLAIAGIVVVALVAGGVLLRHFTRPRES